MKSIALIDIRLFLYKHYHRKESLLNVLEAIYSVSPIRRVTKIFFIYDNGKNSYLKKIYPAYKENRTVLRAKQTDSEKARYKQFSKEYNAFREITKYFGTNVSIPGTEADTFLEVLANKFTNDGDDVYLFSSDGDFNCMLTKPSLYQVTAKGEVLNGEEDVLKKKRVTPKQLFISKCIAGDLKDGIKGIKGLGEIKSKTTGARLRKIVQSDDSVDAIINTLQEYIYAGKYGMKLPENYGVETVQELYDFNKKLNKAFTYNDLTDEHKKELAKQVNVKRVPWDKEGFEFECWKNFKVGINLPKHVLQFYNIKEEK